MQVLHFRLHLMPDPTDPDTTTAAEVRILPADRMRAERASTTELAPSQRGAASQKLHAETWCLLWLWCAATRQNLTTLPFPAFVDTLADYTRVNLDGSTPETAEEVEDEAVDPTRPGASTA